MRLGSWNIGPGVLGWITRNIPEGRTIIELGSGRGSEVLSNRWQVWSVEHDPKWLGNYDTNYIHAPIVNGWYDLSPDDLPEAYHLLLVDGPPGTIGRHKMTEHLDLFDLSVPIIVDDTHRPQELQLAFNLSRTARRNMNHHPDHHEKQFTVI